MTSVDEKASVKVPARRAVLALVAVGAVVLGTAAIAWACTPQASVSISPNAVTAGRQVAISGQDFANGRVEVRWGSGGTVIYNSRGPDFSTSFKVPNVAPGVYYVVATGYELDGKLAGRHSAAVQVQAPPSSSATPPPAAQPGTSGTQEGATGGQESREPRRADRAERSPAAVKRQATNQGAANSSPAAVVRSGQRIFADSVAGSRGKASRGKASALRTTEVAKASEAKSRGLPSLTSPADANALDDKPGARLGIGVALLGLGVLVLLGGFMVAETRRRRAQAHAQAKRRR